MDPIVSKIAKLLALARGKGATPGEAAAAAAKVQELLLEHELSMEQVERAAEASCYGEERHRLLSGRYHRAQWESVLVRTVAENLLCTVIQIGDSREVALIGRAHVIAVAVHLYVYLQREIARLARAEAPHYRKHSARDRWERKFALGAIVAIGQRLRARRHEAQADSAMGALVLHTKAALEREVARRYPRLRDGGSIRPRHDSIAWMAGLLAGRGIPLDDAVGAGRRAVLRASGGDVDR